MAPEWLPVAEKSLEDSRSHRQRHHSMDRAISFNFQRSIIITNWSPCTLCGQPIVLLLTVGLQSQFRDIISMYVNGWSLW